MSFRSRISRCRTTQGEPHAGERRNTEGASGPQAKQDRVATRWQRRRARSGPRSEIPEAPVTIIGIRRYAPSG
ncbi:MAG: hypothetical protein QOG61_1454 [Candidatus Binataceae bacterium]|jgi:hypothetical protein|nr:hypothetical protein [Candidatus Binataceae bacterium]